ncbi:MAG: DUF4388 domain-containing protein [Myxococcales bacterium]|nr:DUF4388 domain-containing protein [Myxococcales bacterium]
MSRAAQTQEPDGSSDVLLRGDLATFTLASLLQLAETNAINARLAVADVGALGLRDGLVVSAQSGAASGLPALHALFFARRGAFVVTAGAPAERAPLGTADELISQASRLVDEWERVSNLVLKVTSAFTGSSDTLPVDDLLLLVDGSATVHELVAELEYAPPIIIHDLLRAIDDGLVEVVDEAERRRTPKTSRPRPQDFYELLDHGRDLMRSGDLVRAEIALRRAVRAQPDNKLARQNLRRVVQMRSNHE